MMASLIRFAEDKLKLVVNRVKSQTAPLKACAFLGFQIGPRGKAAWTAKALARFKERVREITRRNRGHRVQDVIDELRLYVTGWLNCFGISHSYKAVLELGDGSGAECVWLQAHRLAQCCRALCPSAEDHRPPDS